MEILGLIPARGGSRGILHKNIARLLGRPLLAYTGRAAKASKRLTRVVLSTDDPLIALMGKKIGLEVPFLRPKILAKDTTPMVKVVLHALNVLRIREGYEPDVIVILQPTSPLRRAHHIDDAIKELVRTGADTVVSVVEVPHQFGPESLMKRDEKGFLRPLVKGPLLLRRQDKPRYYARNGPAIFAVRRKTLEQGRLYGDKITPYVMAMTESVDIDGPVDLALAAYWLKKAQRPNR